LTPEEQMKNLVDALLPDDRVRADWIGYWREHTQEDGVLLDFSDEHADSVWVPFDAPMNIYTKQYVRDPFKVRYCELTAFACIGKLNGASKEAL